MSKKEKTIIHEFDPCIYPRKLWVVKGGTLDDIRGTLEFELEKNECGGAVTFFANGKKSKLSGYCVWFPNARDINNLNWVAHESTHTALCIFDDIGAKVSYEDQEPLAYLVGWVFECIDVVRKFKKRKEVEDDGSTES